MKVYQDIFSNEEIVSDSFTIVPLFGGVGGEVKSQYITKGGENIDIGRGNEFGGSGGDEDTDDKEEKILNLVAAFRYNETSFGKADYLTYIKGYMKKVKEHLEKVNPDRVKGFMEGASEMVKFIVKNFDEFSFYSPESYDMDNSIILAYYKEGDETPTFLYFMEGLNGVVY